MSPKNSHNDLLQAKVNVQKDHKFQKLKSVKIDYIKRKISCKYFLLRHFNIGQTLTDFVA